MLNQKNVRLFVLLAIFIFSSVLAACGEADNSSVVVEEAPPPPVTIEKTIEPQIKSTPLPTAAASPHADAQDMVQVTPTPETILTETPEPLTPEGFLREAQSYSTGMELMVAFYDGPTAEGHWFDIFDGEGVLPSDVEVIGGYVFDVKLWGSQDELDELYRCALSQVRNQSEFLTCLMTQPEEEETTNLSGQEVDESAIPEATCGTIFVETYIGTIDIVTGEEVIFISSNDVETSKFGDPSKVFDDSTGCWRHTYSWPSNIPNVIQFSVEGLWEGDIDKK